MQRQWYSKIDHHAPRRAFPQSFAQSWTSDRMKYPKRALGKRCWLHLDWADGYDHKVDEGAEELGLGMLYLDATEL